MFTGIIQEIGTIQNLEPTNEVLRLTIKSVIAKNKKVGDSIAVDGACLP